jgi:thymidylate kinase
MRIAIEGHDYTGKTVTSNKLAEMGYQKVIQPGNKHIRKFIKEELKGEVNETIMGLAQALDRHWLNEQLGEGDYIMDRSVFSSLIMQTDDIPLSIVAAMNDGLPLPDMLFWLRISEKELKRRMNNRKEIDFYDSRAFKIKERYDLMMPSFRKKVGLEFHEIFCDNKSPEEIAEEIHEIINNREIVVGPTKTIRDIFGSDIDDYTKDFIKGLIK